MSKFCFFGVLLAHKNLVYGFYTKSTSKSQNFEKKSNFQNIKLHFSYLVGVDGRSWPTAGCTFHHTLIFTFHHTLILLPDLCFTTSMRSVRSLEKNCFSCLSSLSAISLTSDLKNKQWYHCEVKGQRNKLNKTVYQFLKYFMLK